MEEHYASEDDARCVVEPYIENWEFDACLEHGPDYFKLDFSKSKIIHRSPAEPIPGVAVGVRAAIEVIGSLGEARGCVLPLGYPSPPAVVYGYDRPDVRTLVHRYEGCRQGNEQLPSFAYFCVTVLEHSVGPGKRLRKKAANRYQVAKQLLDRIGSLCDDKGGTEARKGKAVNRHLTSQERDFLERATIALIRRVAEYHAGAQELRIITPR